MYLPGAFNEKNPNVIFEFLKQNAFATLISHSKTEPVASHLPLLVEMQDNQLHVRGHFARANEHWLQLRHHPESLIIFQGPHSYISPTYYKGAGVPTWNYVAVHAYGSATITEDNQDIITIIEQLTETNESAKADSWQSNYPENMLKAIVGFDIKVDRLQAKYKLSQNKSQDDQQGVIEQLSSLNDENSRAIAELMKKRQ